LGEQITVNQCEISEKKAQKEFLVHGSVDPRATKALPGSDGNGVSVGFQWVSR
jgi:hypothetical protein